ncbi:MAG: M3 family metallopeptidase [Bacteroidales bacterium]|nr:M3 family metallopeptidase [Bacteroidales bacterium]MCF8390708.1 M3 family metallopeptidase [Bacteroidales bacterium]
MLLLLITLSACNSLEKNKEMKNPLLSEFSTPFGVPPFEEIKLEHFVPATQEAMKLHDAEINDIIANPEAPDFENTIVALERSGMLLDQVNSVFSNLNSSLTGPEMQEIATTLSPVKSAHQDGIRMNTDLFARVKAVYDNQVESKLQGEDSMLLEKTYKYFVRGGANLNEEDKEKLKKINEKLSLASVNFGKNVLAEINNFKLIIDNEADLSGLPSGVKSAAAETAAENGEEGKWMFTVQKPSMLPFLTYSENRELRQKLHTAYCMIGNNDNENDNKEIIKEIVKLRAERARLLGYNSHADYILEENMAKNAENVQEFLLKVWTPGLAKAKQELAELQAMVDREGLDFEIESWDWWYYTEKLRQEKYALDEETLSQYFVADNVRDGAFQLATNLYGLQFVRLTDVPKYQEDVQVFEVKEADGTHVGILYMDFFPRASKRAGAWMSEYRGQKKMDGVDIRPVVTTNFNFTKPTGDTPSLLTSDEVSTTFHEFGHALHGLLSNCTYSSLAGTSVSRDFVELPSQIMENWAFEPEVLKTYAKHYKTGEIIPEDLVKKLQASSYFNQGFTTTEFMSATFLDKAYHELTVENANIEDVNAFEKATLDEIGLIDEIVVRYRSPYFSHIFAGGYSMGYYAYIWAEVLDSDAFIAFKETGDLYNQTVAKAFRDNVLSKGGTVDPMVLYVNFRGQAPGPEALLAKRGLLN